MDKPTFEEIVQEHRAGIRRTLRFLGVGVHDLDDVMQEVLCAVHRRLPAFDPSRAERQESAVRSWLFGICKRQVANSRRKRRHRAEDVRDTFELDRFRHTSKSPEDRFLDCEHVACLEQALAEMAPARRAVFIAHAIHGIPMDEVAREQGIPVNSAWNRLRLARQDVKAALMK